MLTFSVHLVIEFKAKHFATNYPRENKIFSKTALFTVGSGSILSQKRGTVEEANFGHISQKNEN